MQDPKRIPKYAFVNAHTTAGCRIRHLDVQRPGHIRGRHHEPVNAAAAAQIVPTALTLRIRMLATTPGAFSTPATPTPAALTRLGRHGAQNGK